MRAVTFPHCFLSRSGCIFFFLKKKKNFEKGDNLFEIEYSIDEMISFTFLLDISFCNLELIARLIDCLENKNGLQEGMRVICNMCRLCIVYNPMIHAIL